MLMRLLGFSLFLGPEKIYKFYHLYAVLPRIIFKNVMELWGYQFFFKVIPFVSDMQMAE